MTNDTHSVARQAAIAAWKRHPNHGIYLVAYHKRVAAVLASIYGRYRFSHTLAEELASAENYDLRELVLEAYDKASGEFEGSTEMQFASLMEGEYEELYYVRELENTACERCQSRTATSLFDHDSRKQGFVCIECWSEHKGH